LNIFLKLTLTEGVGVTDLLMTRLWVGRPKNHGLIPSRSKSFFLFSKLSHLVGTRTFFMGVKQPELEADHSSLPSAEVKNEWKRKFPSQNAYIPVPLVFRVYLKWYNL